MDIIIYGLGKRFWNNKKHIDEIFKTDSITAYADKLAYSMDKVDGLSVILPNEINKKRFDYIVVIAADYLSIKKDLIQQEIIDKKIISLDDYERIKKRGLFTTYPVKSQDECKKIIIGINDLGLHGGTIACFNMACELQKMGYGVDVAAYRCTDNNLIELFNKNYIGVKIFNSYPFIGGEDVNLFADYDYAIGNTVATICFVEMAHNRIPTLWWIHEAADLDRKTAYEEAINTSVEFEKEWLNNVSVIAVSNKAKSAYINVFNYDKVNVLPLGIEDEKVASNKTDDITFAVIGYIREDKNQLQFLEAYRNVCAINTRCLVIGKDISQERYSTEIDNIIKYNPNITMLGQVKREKLLELYSDIDVVVCPSLLESMSLTIVEGMMNSKICITTDGTGVADYIEDGVNGFVCKAGDVESLVEKMQYVIDHFDELDEVRKNARATYEKYFTLDILGDNLERELKLAEENFVKVAEMG